jgi:predicted small secreted protein
MTDRNEMKSVLKSAWRVSGLIAVAAAALALSACNTVSGAGKDLQEASDNVKDAIND